MEGSSFEPAPTLRPGWLPAVLGLADDVGGIRSCSHATRVASQIDLMLILIGNPEAKQIAADRRVATATLAHVAFRIGCYGAIAGRRSCMRRDVRAGAASGSGDVVSPIPLVEQPKGEAFLRRLKPSQ